MQWQPAVVSELPAVVSELLCSQNLPGRFLPSPRHSGQWPGSGDGLMAVCVHCERCKTSMPHGVVSICCGKLKHRNDCGD